MTATVRHIANEDHPVPPPDEPGASSSSNGHKAPPHSLPAERALIGAMLLSAAARDQAVSIVDPGDYYLTLHGELHRAIATLHAAGEPVDVLTVLGELGDLGLHDQLVAIQSETPATTSAPAYARTVARTAHARRLIDVAARLHQIAYTADVDAALALLEQTIDTATRTATDAPTIGQLLPPHLDLLEARSTAGIAAGVQTGWTDLDKLLGGLRGGQLITIAGRPGMGKTDVAVTLALNVAATQNPTLVVSIEMGADELLDRYIASAGKLDQDLLRTGKLAPKDWERVAAATTTLLPLPVYLADDPTATLNDVRRHARQTPGLALIIVDYLQLVAATGKHENRQVEVAEISRGLKRLARTLGVPVVALAQLNRELETRKDKRPILSDVRESGAIEADSDTVIGLYRDEYYNPKTDQKGILEMDVLKQRNGPTGRIQLAYQPDRKQINNLSNQAPL